jgi:hypothetical protein
MTVASGWWPRLDDRLLSQAADCTAPVQGCASYVGGGFRFVTILGQFTTTTIDGREAPGTG